MKFHWDVDDTTVVDLKFGGFGKNRLNVNGTEFPLKLGQMKKNAFAFELTGPRRAVVTATPNYLLPPDVELRVDGQLIAPTKKPIKCKSCGAPVNPNDRFCASCGAVQPSPEERARTERVAQATGTMWGLCVLFLIAGVIMFVSTKAQIDPVLADLAKVDPNAQLPEPINGVTYTADELRRALLTEQWSGLAVNFGLSAIMAGLAFWGRRAPLPAIIVATATYVVVVIVNFLLDPSTLGQGIYVKIFVLFFLYRGIRSALELRSTQHG